MELLLGFKQRSSNGSSRFFISRKLFVVCTKFLTPCDNVSLKSLQVWPISRTFHLFLFIGEQDNTICCVDDLTFCATNEMDIVALAVQLQTEGVDWEQEDDAARILGVHIEHDPKTGYLNIIQKDLLKWVLETLSLSVETTSGKFTPVKGKNLIKHAHGEHAFWNFNYSSVVGMLFYLAGQECPDITYLSTVLQDMYSVFFLRLVHRHALKQNGCYMQATSDKE